MRLATPVISVRGLSRTFGDRIALQSLDFQMGLGEVVALLGPNGAGKSTCMKVLTGYLAPSAGTVEVCGVNLLTHPQQAQQHLGYLPEHAPADDDVTVRAWLHFAGRVRGLGTSERARAIERVTESCDLTDRLGQMIGTLSRGYRQRVGLASALLHNPTVLILDEPTTGLDPNQIAEIRSVIRQIGERRTVILSTHVLSEVQALCDRALVLHQGRLVADRDVQSLSEEGDGQRLTLGLGHGKVQIAQAELLRQLGQLEGVQKVHLATAVDEAHRVQLQSRTDIRETVYRWAVNGGHVLVHLDIQHQRLEEVFRQLTKENS
ncbi:MAG: ATP-binding cassette domain-containing protein [Rhodobacterales bacterium]|nr:ATP-binding cassette domain-containing protein [Rhodobacterales bacterium]